MKRMTCRQTTRLPCRTRSQRAPPLRLTPYAWAKLLFLRDAGPTEVGGFGISSACDLLLIEDIRLVRQECSAITVAFEDAAVADYFDDQVDLGRTPEAFARIWVHTHPGSSPMPSTTDEATFERCFGGADWAIMFIVARSGHAYARVRFHAGPGGQIVLPVEVDFSKPFAAADHAAWQAEYENSVVPRSEWLPDLGRRTDQPERLGDIARLDAGWGLGSLDWRLEDFDGFLR